MADPNDFNDLLNAAELMAADTDGTSDLPKWNRTVHQLAEAAEEMWERIGSKASGQENQANVLLAPKGVDIPQMSQKLQSISTRKTFQPLDPVGDIDVKAYLKNEYENGILSILSITQKLSAQTVARTTWSHNNSTWQAEKNRVANAMLGSKKTYLDVPLDTEESTLLDIPMAKSMLSQQEMAYARGVTEYNQTIMDGLVHPDLINKFYEIAKGFQDQRVLDLWEMVKYMVDIPQRLAGDVITARSSPSVQSDLILQSKKYLEQRYRSYMKSVVSGNLRKAMRGGVPGTFSLVRSFVSVRVPPTVIGLEDGRIEGQPVWPLIYYCLRSGDVAAALDVARRADSSLTEFSSILESLVHATDFRLGARVEQRVKAQYRRYTRNTTDPYKRAVYCVVGACDVNEEHPEVALTADDYLWFKLCQIRHEDNAETKGERMTYTHLQSMILEEYGESYYKANEQPLIYFQMLILTGQFEAAIEFLYRMPKLKVHGVHVAIALHELGLLADPPSVLAPLLTDEDRPPARRLNFVRLINLYVRSFQSSDPREALQYFYFLREMSNDTGENLFTVCVGELVQQSREFDLILGRLEPDGCRSPGLIDWFKGLKESSADIIRHVANDCEIKGNLEDAILLFDLANEHEKVMSIMNTLLTQVVTQVCKPGSLRARLQALANQIASRYQGIELAASADTAATFAILRGLLAFFDQYHAGQHSLALETITKSKLLPFTKEEISERVANFKRLHDQVKRHFADILVVVMTILQSQYQSAKGSDPHAHRLEDHARDKQMLSFVRERARVITNFAGSIPYRMKGDTSSRLVQMEIVMQ